MAEPKPPVHVLANRLVDLGWSWPIAMRIADDLVESLSAAGYGLVRRGEKVPPP